MNCRIQILNFKGETHMPRNSIWREINFLQSKENKMKTLKYIFTLPKQHNMLDGDVEKKIMLYGCVYYWIFIIIQFNYNMKCFSIENRLLKPNKPKTLT